MLARLRCIIWYFWLDVHRGREVDLYSRDISPQTMMIGTARTYYSRRSNAGADPGGVQYAGTDLGGFQQN
jgi:hypothetical protein